MTPDELKARGLRVRPLEWECQQANGYRYGRWSSKGGKIDRLDGEQYLYGDEVFFSHAMATEKVEADHAARICAALEPIAPPMDVTQHAQALIDAFANDGNYSGGRLESGIDWGLVWRAMASEYKEQGWTDWPAIFDAALRAIAGDDA